MDCKDIKAEHKWNINYYVQQVVVVFGRYYYMEMIDRCNTIYAQTQEKDTERDQKLTHLVRVDVFHWIGLIRYVVIDFLLCAVVYVIRSIVVVVVSGVQFCAIQRAQ